MCTKSNDPSLISIVVPSWFKDYSSKNDLEK